MLASISTAITYLLLDIHTTKIGFNVIEKKKKN